MLATKERIIAQRQFATERYILSTLPLWYLPLHRLDSGSSGGSFTSADGGGQLCTVTGATIHILGRTFDGTDDFINLGNFTRDGTTNKLFSVMAWVKFDVVNASQTIWGSGAATGSPPYYVFYLNSTGVLRVAMGNNGTNYFIWEGATALSAETWYFLAMTQDGQSTPDIYINNVAESISVSSSAGTANYPGTNAASLGRWGANSSTYFDGLMGEVLIYNKVLFPLNIQNIQIATQWRYR